MCALRRLRRVITATMRRLRRVIVADTADNRIFSKGSQQKNFHFSGSFFVL